MNQEHFTGLIRDDDLADVTSIMHSDEFADYAKLVSSTLNARSVDYAALFSASVGHLNSLTTRPNKALAHLFFILSALKDIPPEAEEFAVEAMIYCENTDDYELSIGKTALLDRYNNAVRPLLTQR